jgi:hypothetical protein
VEFVYPHISIVAVIAAAIAQFALGFLWYSPMTPPGRLWMSEMRVDPSTLTRPGIEMAVFPISSLLAAWAVAMVIGWSHADGIGNAVLAAWVVGVAVVAQALGSAVANRQTVTLAALHVGYLVVGYTIMGVLIDALS